MCPPPISSIIILYGTYSHRIIINANARRKDNDYLERFNNKYVPLVNDCISSLIEKNDDEFFNNLLELSKMQIEMLGHTIPENVKEFFFFDIDKNGFQVKLCGAGGGGFLLGFSNDIQKTNDFFEKNNKNIIWVK